jgi:hypothetical protein
LTYSLDFTDTSQISVQFGGLPNPGRFVSKSNAAGDDNCLKINPGGFEFSYTIN